MGEHLKCKQDWRHHAITLCFLFKLMKDYIHREEPHALQNISCSLSVHLLWKRKEMEKQFICIHVYAPCSILDKCCVNAITTFTDWFKLTTKINCLQTITGIQLWKAFRTTGTLCKPLVQKSYTSNNVISDKRMQIIASRN